MCRFSLIGSEGTPSDLLDRSGENRKLTIATSLPRYLNSFLTPEQQDNVEILELGGSVEATILLGATDIIADLVQSGGTIRDNGLKEVEVLDEIIPMAIWRRN